MNPIYSIVIPVFNSEHTLWELYRRILKVMEPRGEPFEIIFIEDCGGDGAWFILQKIAQQDSRVVAIQLLNNVGQGSATLAGLAQAKGIITITLDDDLQHPPEEIAHLIATLNRNDHLDVIMGIPKVKRHNFFRRMGSALINRLNNFFIKKAPELRTSSFRIMRHQVVTALLSMNIFYPSLGPMILTVTQRIGNVVVDHHSRKEGRSGYTFLSLIRQSLSNIVGYSVMPLHVLAILGLMGILFCGFFATYFLTRYFVTGINIPGWMILLLMMITFSSFNFLAFSLIGEYVLRIMRITTAPSQWNVRQMMRQEEQISKNDSSNEGSIHVCPTN